MRRDLVDLLRTHVADEGLMEDAADLIEKLKELVRASFNDGFFNGQKECTTSKGGRSWHDSQSRERLEALFSPHERRGEP